jgi:hypothetical protein
MVRSGHWWQAAHHQLSALLAVIVFLVASLLAFHMHLAITPNQLLLSIPCFKLVALQLAINDHS